MVSATLVEAHRADVATLTALAENDLAQLWQQFTTAEMARDALMDVLPEFVSVYGTAASVLGADWYDELRADLNIPGRFRAAPIGLPDRGRTDALARWGVDPLFQAEPDFDAALTLIGGGLQRIVADASRLTVAAAAVNDPQADGWQRLGIGANCVFCDMLIARGSVYQESTAAFAAHDHCNCFAAPAFKGAPRPVQPYTPSIRTGSEADRARVREYLRTH